MRFVKGDIIKAQHGIIGFTTSCDLSTESFLIKELKEVYPSTYRDFLLTAQSINVPDRLGKCIMNVAIPNRLYIAALFDRHHRLQEVDHTALSMALRSLERWRKLFIKDGQVYLPKYMGSPEKKWDSILGIIKGTVTDAIIVRQEL